MRHDLANAELITFLAEVRQHLETLLNALDCETAQLLRQVPEEADIASDLKAALRAVINHEIALAPAIPGRK